MVIFLNTGGHTMVAIVTIFMIFAIMGGHKMAVNSNILWSFLTLLQRLAKMQVSNENGIKKYALYTKLWTKKQPDCNNGHFICILRWFWLKNGPSRGGTSHVSSELIFTFLESGEQGELE